MAEIAGRQREEDERQQAAEREWERMQLRAARGVREFSDWDDATRMTATTSPTTSATPTQTASMIIFPMAGPGTGDPVA